MPPRRNALQVSPEAERDRSGQVGPGADEAVFVGVHDGLNAVAQLDLAEYTADMGLDSGLGQRQLGGDLGVGQPGGDLGKDLALPGGQRREFSWLASAR